MNYQELVLEIKNLDRSGFDFFLLGESTFHEPIYAAHIGSYRGRQEIVQGALHAREYITASLVVQHALYLQETLAAGGIYFIPMTNPDGVRLVLEGAEYIPSIAHRRFLAEVNGSDDFRHWKANGNAVDLNTNFPADWGKGKGNVFQPAEQSFVGNYPASERETRLLMDFTLSVRPAVTLSYHTKGEVIYYGFQGESKNLAAKSRDIAKKLAASAGYDALTSNGSSGGYKDWCVSVLKIPAFTIETGADTLSHPIGKEHLSEMFERTKNLPLIAFNEVL